MLLRSKEAAIFLKAEEWVLVDGGAVFATKTRTECTGYKIHGGRLQDSSKPNSDNNTELYEQLGNDEQSQLQPQDRKPDVVPQPSESSRPPFRIFHLSVSTKASHVRALVLYGSPGQG